MQNCPQTESQSVYDHGMSVWEYSKKLISGQTESFKLPDIFKQYQVDIINNMVDINTYRRYVLYHDCGKPYCIEYDAGGRKHFPNHAEISKNIWSQLYPDDTLVSELISLDMVMHTCKNDVLDTLSKQISCTLIISALSELHSNANMFGGIESVSFKIKYKALEKRIKFLINKWFAN